MSHFFPFSGTTCFVLLLSQKGQAEVNKLGFYLRSIHVVLKIIKNKCINNDKKCKVFVNA